MATPRFSSYLTPTLPTTWVPRSFIWNFDSRFGQALLLHARSRVLDGGRADPVASDVLQSFAHDGVVAQGVGLFGSGHVGVAKSGSSCRRCRRRSPWCRTGGGPRSGSCRRRGWRLRWICSPSHSRWKDGHAPCTRTMCQSDNRLMYTAVVVLTLAHHGHSSQVRGHRIGF